MFIGQPTVLAGPLLSAAYLCHDTVNRIARLQSRLHHHNGGRGCVGVS